MKHLTIVIPQGIANLSSIAGTFEILHFANTHWQKLGNESVIEIQMAGFTSDMKMDVPFFSAAPVDIREIKRTDLVIIPSVADHYDDVIEKNTALIEWIRDQYKNGSEVASICTGVFLLAATGLLDGRTCSTHWNAAADFRRLFPQINLNIDKLITAERGIYTNGGAYSFLNLVILLVEKFFDRQTAILCSKGYQIDINRTSQSSFIIFQAQKEHGDDLICQAQTFMEENLTEKFSFGELALKLAISRRNFDRRFIKATGNTPMEYLQRVKVEAAKRILEIGRKNIFEVMYEVGYSDDKAFREVFKKVTGLSPLDYRMRYNTEFGSDPSARQLGMRS